MEDAVLDDLPFGDAPPVDPEPEYEYDQSLSW